MQQVLAQSIGVALLLFMPLWAHRVILPIKKLNPLDDNERFRFSSSDFMLLISMIAAGTTLSINVNSDGVSKNWLLMVSLNSLFALLWYRCVLFMNQYKIQGNGARILMQLFVFPSTIVCLSLLLVCSVYLLLIFSGSQSIESSEVVEITPTLLLLEATTCFGIFATHKMFSLFLRRGQA